MNKKPRKPGNCPGVKAKRTPTTEERILTAYARWVDGPHGKRALSGPGSHLAAFGAGVAWATDYILTTMRARDL